MMCLIACAERAWVFDKYFLTPTNLSFKKLCDAFEIDYKELKTQSDIFNHIKVSSVRRKPAVFEVKTNADYSLSLRKKYWKKSNKVVENFLRNYEAWCKWGENKFRTDKRNW